VKPDNDDAAIHLLLDQIRRRTEREDESRIAPSLLQHFAPPVDVAAAEAEAKAKRSIAELRTLRTGLAGFASTSRIPGGSLLHRVIGRSVRRDTQQLADRIDLLVQQIADVIEATAGSLIELEHAREYEFERIRRSDRERTTEMIERLQRTFEADLRSASDARTALQSLCEEVAKHTEFIRLQEFRPPFSNIDYGDRFRGSRSDLLLRYHDVADRLVEVGGPVLDLGCGRGELIELVMAKGGFARGVELDPELVDFCRSIFLDVVQLSAQDALEAEPDDSLGGVAMIQVVEHLTAQELVETVTLAHRKLRAGGRLVIETVNATSPFVFTRSFYCDPTHSTPVHHEYLEFVLERAGFTTVGLSFRSPVPDADQLSPIESSESRANPDHRSEEASGGAHDPVQQLESAVNDRFVQINRFLFGAQDYLMVATK
jgi:SAM-dependent methyltransferase